MRRSATERKLAATAAAVLEETGNDDDDGEVPHDDDNREDRAAWHRCIEFWLDANEHDEPELCRTTALWLASGHAPLDIDSLKEAGYTVGQVGAGFVSIDCATDLLLNDDDDDNCD